jgi:hypothetical protein
MHLELLAIFTKMHMNYGMCHNGNGLRYSHLSQKEVKQRISIVRKQLNHYMSIVKPNPVDFDAMHELSDTLTDLRERNREINNNILDYYCLQDPSAGECRIYDM